MTDRDFFFSKKKKRLEKLCAQTRLIVLVSFQCFAEKSDPVMFVLLLLPCVIVIAIIFSQTCEFISVLFLDESFCLGTLI